MVSPIALLLPPRLGPARLHSPLFCLPTTTGTGTKPEVVASASATFTSSTVFTLLSAMAIAISYADRSNLSTAIIPMTETFHWSSLFSGLVLSAFWAGYALTNIIGGKLADKFGGEWLLVLAMVLWSACTAATPIAAFLGPTPLIIVRILLGAGEGLALPSIVSMIQKYVAPADKSLATGVITSACYLGALLSNLFSPLIIQQFGWQQCFYIFAFAAPALWLPLWLTFQSQQPSLPTLREPPIFKDLFSDKSPLDSTLSSLDKYLSPTTSPLLKTTPTPIMSLTEPLPTTNILGVRSLLKFPAVWAIILTQYCQSWGMIGLLSWLPSYYADRYGVALANLGAYTVLPYLLQIASSIAAGKVADAFIQRGARRLPVRKWLQTIGMLGPAVCFTYCALGNSLSADTAAAVIAAGSALSAVTVGAVSCNHFDISRFNAGTIFGIGNTAACIGGLAAVPISGYIFDLTHSWDNVFLLFSFHYIAGALLFNVLADDKFIDAPPLQDTACSSSSKTL